MPKEGFIVFMTLYFHESGDKQTSRDIVLSKFSATLSSFVMEDLFQMFCQYYYFEKYATSLDVFALANGCIMMIIGILLIRHSCRYLRDECRNEEDDDEEEGSCLAFLISLFPLTIIATQVMRLALLIYQSLRTGELNFIENYEKF